MKMQNYVIGLIIFISLLLGLAGIALRNFELSHSTGTEVTAANTAATAALTDIKGEMDTLSTQINNIQDQLQTSTLFNLIFQTVPALIVMLGSFIWFGVTLPDKIITFVSLSLYLPDWFGKMLLYSAMAFIGIKIWFWIRGTGES